MSVLPSRAPLQGKGGGRGGCEGIRTHSRDPHGRRPAVDLPLTLVASVPLPGCVVPGAGLVGGTGMGRMEKETDLKGRGGEEPGSGARRRWESDSVTPARPGPRPDSSSRAVGV